VGAAHGYLISHLRRESINRVNGKVRERLAVLAPSALTLQEINLYLIRWPRLYIARLALRNALACENSQEPRRPGRVDLDVQCRIR